MPHALLRCRGIFVAVMVVMSAGVAATEPTENSGAIGLQTRSFVYGREYFVLRSGRAQMIMQADKVDLGPAVTYLLFDAEDNRQSARKETAFNFANGEGLAASGLAVVLGGFPFTSLGHETLTQWVTVEGIPAVEATWWAGGMRVSEQMLALGDQGLFLRRIHLTSANLGGPEEISLRLALPPGACNTANGWFARDGAPCRMALGLASEAAARAVPESRGIEIGPLDLDPGESVTVDTLLLAQIPGTPADTWPPLAAISKGAAGLSVFDIGAVLGQTREAWARSSRVVTSDAAVQDMFDKARWGLAAMVADKGIMNAGIFEYGAQWVRDTSNTLLGLVHAGHFEQARRGFDYILKEMVNAEGNTMIAGGFDDPDREQFDQMGELLHAIKAYRDWTGDDSLIREHREKLLVMIERVLRPEFRDQTGMVHNRREFWERTFDDAYELAYQTYVILGLRTAAALAEPLQAGDRAPRWLAEADRIQQAMLEQPGCALVENECLIKRRAVTGEPVRTIHFPAAAADVPLKTERVNLSMPDATMALPIVFGLVPPQSTLARNTLEELERLRDGRWFGGGYERYHSSGQCDQPGPWTFATCFILRAQHDAGQYERSRRTLEWLNTVQGGRTGAWFEAIPLLRSQAPFSGILPWTSGEVSLFIVRHLLGISFQGEQMILKPALYPGSPPITADLRFRQGRIQFEIPAAGKTVYAEINGVQLNAREDGAIVLPADFAGGRVVVRTQQ